MKTSNNFFTRMMSMDDDVWERHASPWSVWTRVVTGLPMLLGSLWTVRVIGWWSGLVILFVIIWIWLNPRLFKPPSNTMNWASKVTFGERVWLNRKHISIPAHHVTWANALSWVSGIGFFAAAYGAVQHSIIFVLVGGTISWVGKMWFCDRMVWLYEDMKGIHEPYNSWLKGCENNFKRE